MSIQFTPRVLFALGMGALLAGCNQPASTTPEMPAQPEVVAPMPAAQNDTAPLSQGLDAPLDFVDVNASLYVAQALALAAEHNQLDDTTRACLTQTAPYRDLATQSINRTLTPEGIDALGAFFQTPDGQMVASSLLSDVTHESLNHNEADLHRALESFATIAEAHQLPADASTDATAQDLQELNDAYTIIEREFARCNVQMPQGWLESLLQG